MMNIGKLAFTIILLLTTTLANAQSISEIKSDKSYIWGEGRASTPKKADASALDELISQISVNVESDFTQITKNVVTGETPETTVTLEGLVKTYSGATLNNAYRLENHDPKENKWYVFRYMHRSEIDKVFESRRNKVRSYVDDAVNALSNKQIDNALRNFNWALVLLQSLPRPNEVKHRIADKEEMLVTYIPNKILDIFSKVKIHLTECNLMDGRVELSFTYNGIPVSSIDYKYFDGQSTSGICSASNGRGVCEVNPNIPISTLDVMCEYVYSEQAHIDKELLEVIDAMGEDEYFARESRYKVPVSPDAVQKQTYNTSVIHANERVNTVTQYNVSEAQAYSTVKELDGSAKQPYEDILNKISNAIKNKTLDSVESYFTAQGWDMFNKLIRYGKAQLLTQSERTYLQADNWIICRSLPMQFAFNNNNRKFVEDVNMTFNADKKIETISFGLGYEALNDIWSHEEWPQTSRLFVINFLENYKTAFALERIDYIGDIFDDNAVIIVGNKTKKAVGDVELNKFSNSEVIKYNRLTKNQYLSNLRRCFDSNEFINIRFGNNDVMRAATGGELYGIQIKQDYYSSNYGDQGYLFLMVDLNNSQKPSIKVRTWQPERDPNFGVYGLPDF